jgi:hypothetical protein
VLVTDKLKSYGGVKREVIPGLHIDKANISTAAGGGPPLTLVTDSTVF